MAKQKGVIKISGTVEGLNFYFSKGKAYVRAAGGGFNGDAIRTKANMVRVRENSTEFGAASKALKQFRRALRPVFNPPKHRALHVRLMRLFAQLKDLDPVSERGERGVLHGIGTAKGRQLLTHFMLLPDCRVLDAIAMHGQFDWASQTLTFNAMDFSGLRFPKGATHAALSLIVVDFDFEHLTYTSQISETILLNHGPVAPFTLTPETVVAPQHTGIVALGLRFCEVLEDEVYPAKGISGLGCVVLEIA